MNIAQEVDARGLNCPLPILKAKKALSDMESGQILRVMATRLEVHFGKLAWQIQLGPCSLNRCWK